MVAPICAPIAESWACQRLSAQCARRRQCLPTRCSCGKAVQHKMAPVRGNWPVPAGWCEHVDVYSIQFIRAHHSGHLSRPCQRCWCHTQRSRCRVLPKRRGRLASTGLSSRLRSDASDLTKEIHGITCNILRIKRARWRQAEPCGRPDAVRSCCAPLPAIRSSATKSLPCRVAAGLPIACLLMTTHSEDHSDFSSISRSRTPNADHCGFGLLFHLLSNPTGLPACRMLTPNLPTTMEIRLTGQAALQPETEARQQSRKLPTCMM